MPGGPRFTRENPSVWQGTCRKEAHALAVREHQTANAQSTTTTAKPAEPDSAAVWLAQAQQPASTNTTTTTTTTTAAQAYFRGPLEGGDGERCPRGTLMKKRSGVVLAPDGATPAPEHCGGPVATVQDDAVLVGAHVTSSRAYGWRQTAADVKRGASGPNTWHGRRKLPAEF